jgi:hypothetical protein
MSAAADGACAVPAAAVQSTLIAGEGIWVDKAFRQP